MNQYTKLDLHVHTSYSYDSVIDVKKLVKIARDIGLNGLAVTDHDTLRGLEKIREFIGSSSDFIIVPGIEVTTNRGHLLLLNIDHYELDSNVFYEVVDYGRAHDALVIIPHPLDPFRKFRDLYESIGVSDGLEVANSSDILVYRHYDELVGVVERNNKFFTAGSDAHIEEAIGTTFLYVEEELDGLDEVIKYLVEGRFRVHLGRTPLIHRFRKLLYQYLPLSK